MKRLIASVLLLCMLLLTISASAATDARVTENRISTRSGPGTRYTEPGSFLQRGAQLTVHTRVWDDRNEIYWVQVEFVSGNQRYRAYTGAWRLDVNLNAVPDETVLAYTWLNYTTCGYAGPGYDYHYYDDVILYQYGSCAVIEVENNFALVDTSDSNLGETRVWLPVNAIAGGDSFYGQDTYPDEYGYQGGGNTWQPDDDQGATLLPGGENNDWYGGGYVDPVGQYVTIWVESGNARSGPGTGYSHMNYVHAGDRLLVLDYQMGNTGKDWYQVRIDGRLCWLSSGLVTLNGNSEGTAYGVPIVPEDPYADYPQTSPHLIGRWVRIGSSSAHVLAEPHTDTQTVAYVRENQCYEILDCRIGSTGRAWYKICVDGVYGWISSGLTTLMGY